VRFNRRLPFLVITFAVLLGGSAFAGVATYSGFDIGTSSIATSPNSVAAAAAYYAATGSLPVIDFESAPLNGYTSLVIAPGVTLTGTTFFGGNQSIINTFVCAPAQCGYNTTPGGSQWADVYGGSITFSFATPISTFGAYFTGDQIAGIGLSFNDGSPQFVPLPGDPNNGGTAFVGFVDTTASFSSVTVTAYNDIIGVDDVGYGGVTPEPGSLVLLGSGVLGIAGVLRRKLM
jgi:hypothetical protein